MVAAYRDSISARAGADPIAVDPSALTYSSGDVLVLHLWAVTSIATPSGSDLTWTQQLSDTIVGPFGNTYCHKVFTAVADASISSFTVDVGAADSQAFILTSVSGADTTTPVDGTPTFASEVHATDPTPQSPSITDLAGTDSLLVAACSVHRNGAGTRTMTEPSGMTEREDFPAGSEFEQFGSATLGLSASTATGDKVWGPSGGLASGEAWMASSIAIKSAGGSTSPSAECATGTGAAHDTTVTTSDQSAGPSTDITTTGWTATGGTGTLASAIDEFPADDADYITSPGNPSGSVAECKFPSFTDPSFSTGHRLDYRVRVRNAGSYTVVVGVYQGTTLIASTSHTSGLTTSFQDFTLTLSGAEADAISDYTDLRVRVTATAAV
jgi:hypothetical protein